MACLFEPALVHLASLFFLRNLANIAELVCSVEIYNSDSEVS